MDNVIAHGPTQVILLGLALDSETEPSGWRIGLMRIPTHAATRSKAPNALIIFRTYGNMKNRKV